MKSIMVLSFVFFATAAHAYDRGGNVDCLDDAKDWIYHNTRAMSNESAEQAIEVCGGGRRRYR